MADFNYAELCLAMDHLYGLKDIHHIDSFDALLYQLGLREMMKSTSAADAAVFVISAVLGDGSVSALNPMTGAMATAVYNVDLNLDHQYGQEDQGLTTKNVYCLTSPVSFSCGNLVPCVFKNSNQVTIIGRTSGVRVWPLSRMDPSMTSIRGPYPILRFRSICPSTTVNA